MGRTGPTARLVFTSIFVASQVALIATASRRPERAFGFREGNEATTVRVALAREVSADGGTAIVPVVGGEWVARDAAGKPRRINVRDRIVEPDLAVFDKTVTARDGAAATLARLQAALDDVASHTPDDTETRALVADVLVQKNGRDPHAVRMRSAPR